MISINCFNCMNHFSPKHHNEKICSACKIIRKRKLNNLRCARWYLRNKKLAYFRQRRWIKKNKSLLDIRYKKIRKDNLLNWKKNNPEKYKLGKRRNEMMRRMIGFVSIKILQEVYEENIKFYGKLTCILCLKQIDFGQDSIEHKTPLFRGGNHDKDNLGISHRVCNSKKYTKTMEECVGVTF